MQPTTLSILTTIKALSITTLLALSNSASSYAITPTIDDFSHDKNTNIGIARMLISDQTAGGKTTVKLNLSDGVMQIKGKIVPPRGQPGWASLVLPLGPMDKPQDASTFSGIRLLVKVDSGNISISANSADITNYDYHSAQVVVRADGDFHEVKIPFETMKRIWSEQTQLNTQTLNSLSIVAFSPQQASFDFAIDEVSFY